MNVGQDDIMNILMSNEYKMQFNNLTKKQKISVILGMVFGAFFGLGVAMTIEKILVSPVLTVMALLMIIVAYRAIYNKTSVLPIFE